MNIDTFRSANKCDAKAIAAVVNRAYRPEPGSGGWTHESDLVSGNRTSTTQVIEILKKPNSVILVGLNNSEIVACIHVEKEGGDSHIGMLAVNPTLQGTGAGKKMLSYAEEYATEVFGAEKFIMVVVSARINLISFYRRRGYKQTGSVMDYPLSAGVGIPRKQALKIEVLEKRSNPAVKRTRLAARRSPLR